MLPIEICAPHWWHKEKRYRRELPESWTEAGVYALPCLRELLLLPDGAAQVSILRRLLRLPKATFLGIPDRHVEDLASTLQWAAITPTATPLIVYFVHKGVTYHIPKEKFSNGTAIEYPIADEYYEQYITEGKGEDLLRLVATLAREERTNKTEAIQKGDTRIPLHSRGEVEARAKRLRKLPEEVQFAVLMYFAGVKEYIHKTYAGWLFQQSAQPDPDDPDDDDDEFYKQQVQSNQPLFGWWGTYMDVAEGGVFGNLDQVHQTNFHTLCMYLVKKKQEADERERQIERMQSNSSNNNA